MRTRYIFVLAFSLILIALPTAAADRGIIVPGDISVYEPGQKAIVAWDGENEVLILSTDVLASENTWALEILPLPSQPRVDEGNFSSFEEVQFLLYNFAASTYARKGMLGEPENAVKILFHENIGAHDITGVEATDAQNLISWAENFLDNKGFTQQVNLGRLENLAAVYIQRGINCFVFDLIDLSDYWKSREPIVYSFKSDYLYFPLEISSLASGETEIILFTLTENKLDASSVEASGFSIASFTADEEKVLIEFEVSENELQPISPRVAELFEGGAWLTALTYAGSLEDLRGDIMFSAAPPEAVNQLLAAAWAAAIVLALLVIFAIIYKLSPYYKTGPQSR